MTYNYAYLDADGWVRQWSSAPRPGTLPDGSQGPYKATPVNGLTLDLLPNGFTPSQYLCKVNGTYTDMSIAAGVAPTPTCELRQSGQALVWVETVVLADRISDAIAATYVDIDAVVRDAVGNRTEEYKEAESDARAYKAAGYTGTVPATVDCYAQHNQTGSVQTGQWAADDIIARADAFASAKLSMRSQRFASQSAMRAASTDADLNTVIASWKQFVADTRSQLGLPSA